MNDNSQRIGGPSGSRLDRAIDRAVRDMMHVDPRPGFRHRVFARLEPASARSVVFPRFAMVFGALAVVLLAMVVVIRDRRPDAGVDSVQHGAAPVQTVAGGAVTSPTPTVTAPAPATSSHVRRSGDRPTRRVTREAIPMPRVTNVFGTRTTGAAAAAVPDMDAVWPATLPDSRDEHASPIAPLVIPPVEAPAPIVIAPLNRRGPGL